MQAIPANSPLARLQRRRASHTASDPSRELSSLSAADSETIAEILASEPDYIDDPAFYEPNAERSIYDDAPAIRKPDASWYAPVMDDLGLKSRVPKSSEQVILTGAEERVLFLQFNYARHRCGQIRDAVMATPSQTPDLETARAMLRWHCKS